MIASAPVNDLQQADLQTLKRQLRSWERPASAAAGCLASGLPDFDNLLPDKGFHPGSLVEWLAPGPGSGAGTLATLIAARILPSDRELVIVDDRGTFYPPAAVSLGVPLGRTVLIRPRTAAETLWACEQALACPGVGVTWIPLADADNRVLRRLQLAAERGRGIGFLLRPARVRRQPSWADLRLLIEPIPPPPGGIAPGRSLRLQVLYVRSGLGGRAAELVIDDDAHALALAPAMAAATAVPGSVPA